MLSVPSFCTSSMFSDIVTYRMFPLNHCNGLRSPIMVGMNSDTVG
jgi:hypothetical protein